MKCAYLGCKNEGKIMDNVETSPGVIKKRCVCRLHLGKLTKNITSTGKFSLTYMFSMESD